MFKVSELESNDFLNEDNLYGSFYLEEEFNEMARFGKVPNSKYEIHIEGGKGNIPHMHICIKNEKNIVLRICLLTNEYFREKDDVKNTLKSKERKALNSYLEEIYNEEFEITRWQNLCMQWNEYNPSHKILNIKKLKKPDFDIIEEPK